MNPRRVHDLMRKHFPEIDSNAHEWINVAGPSGAKVGIVSALVDSLIASPSVIVEVHRKLGGHFPKGEAVAFVCANIGKGQIKIADREFTSFVVVAGNGVATGWRRASAQKVGPGLESDSFEPAA